MSGLCSSHKVHNTADRQHMCNKDSDNEKRTIDVHNNKNVRLPVGKKIHTGLLNFQSDKVSRRLAAWRCGKCL